MPSEIKSYCGSCGKLTNQLDEPIDYVGLGGLQVDEEEFFTESVPVVCLRCVDPDKYKSFRFVGYIGYRVEPDGKIFSYKSKGRKLKPYLDPAGYPTIKIVLGGKRRNFRVHRLVVEVHGDPKPYVHAVICHRDGDRAHPHNDNLVWGSQKDNAADRERHKREREMKKIKDSLQG